MAPQIYFDDVYPEIYAEFTTKESQLETAEPQPKPQEAQLFPINQRNPRYRSWTAMFRAMALAG